ncbi:MAG: 16S rRNA (cytosine(967)-C(5))-methyltransferase RsmB [Candidatus Latescibacterota bacterium]
MPEKTNARKTAFRLLLRIEKGGAFSDRLLAGPQVADLKDPRDRTLVHELVAGVERWKLRLDRVIDMYYTKRANSLSPEIRMILRLGFFQLMFLDAVPARAAVYESVQLASEIQGKGAGSLVNALLRRFTREGEPNEWPSEPAERLSMEMSFPLWLARRWIQNFGLETAQAVMQASNRKHPVFIRSNRLKITQGELSSLLSDKGYDTSKIEEIPGYLSVSESQGLFDSSIFREGYCTVQDPAAGMASILLDPQPGENVLDLCSAPGGKTTHIAELMDDKGQITALDINPGRLRLVEEISGRLGVTSVTAILGNASEFDGDKIGQFDRVLLDVPCTGTGVLAKRPDKKWRIGEEDSGRLAELQMVMLENAARLTKPGGTLVYSTCSLEPEEDGDIIGRFLEKNRNFSQEKDSRFEKYAIDKGYLIFPHLMYGTGSFAAKMKRDLHV